MIGHPQSDEDFDLYALGALNPEEAQALELHLQTCDVCSGKVVGARGRMAALALAAPFEAPPARVRARLLQQIHDAPARRSLQPLQPFPRWLVPALAVASLALAIGIGLEVAKNRKLAHAIENLEARAKRQEAETARARSVLAVLTALETVKVTLVAGTARPVPQGKAYYHSRKGLVFYAANLPALPPHRAYQLWLVPSEGNPLSAGLLQIDAKGDGSILLPDLPIGVTAKAFALTVEPAGGLPQPTGPKVLVGVVS